MLIPGLPGGALGLRELIIGLIALVAVYMLVVLWRMRRLTRNSATEAASGMSSVASAAEPAEAEMNVLLSADAGEIESAAAPAGMAEQLLRLGLEQEIAQLRDELDAVRGELAALRQDMQLELGQLRATQSVSPIYGDAMQLAATGYDPVAIAERCGIARAEAELVVALAKRREQ